MTAACNSFQSDLSVYRMIGAFLSIGNWAFFLFQVFHLQGNRSLHMGLLGGFHPPQVQQDQEAHHLLHKGPVGITARSRPQTRPECRHDTL